MDARIIEKIIEIGERRFVIRKYDAFTGVKISKLMIAKVLPMVQTFLPMLGRVLKDDSNVDLKGTANAILDNLDSVLSLDNISKALDQISGDDLDFIMRSSLMHCFEDLPAGRAQVMLQNGTYGVPDVEYDPLTVVRLVCEAVIWGLADFFTGERLKSILGPLISFERQNLSILTPSLSPR